MTTCMRCLADGNKPAEKTENAKTKFHCGIAHSFPLLFVLLDSFKAFL